MKRIHSIAAILLFYCGNASAQTINWRSFKKEEKLIAGINAGWDYGFTAGVGMGYKFNTGWPLVVHGEFSVPAGKDVFDDFKTKLALQSELVQWNNFSLSAKVAGIFRQYTSPLVQLSNYGAELTVATGYYKRRWYIAAEAGFDKAITTRFKHSREMKDNYPAVQDGWYIPTGGNFLYGLQGGWSPGKNDIGIKIGKVLTQDFKTTPMIPFAFQLSFNRRF